MDDVRAEEKNFNAVGLDFRFNEYQSAAQYFINADLAGTELLGNAAMGVAGEAGEVADLVKKHLYHGHPLAREELVKELGDVLWYVALGCTVLKVPLSEVAAMNIRKLSARYPDGFSRERSLHRDC